jgi:AcrR family transcriptional regulator
MSGPSTSKAPGRPRSDATHKAILNAAIEMLLACEDYRLVSIDKIAARAKVGKQSIYRWWSSKADLILEALTCRSLQRAPPEPASDDAFADLQSFLKRIFAVMREPVANKAVRVLIAEAQFDCEFQKKFWDVSCGSWRRGSPARPTRCGRGRLRPLSSRPSTDDATTTDRKPHVR